MNLKQFLSLLDMEIPEDFEYFEQFAGLMETDEEVPYDFFYTAISAVSPSVMGEILENYMEELMEGLPSDSDELITVLDPLKQELLSKCENIDNPKERTSLAESLYKFRSWLRNGSGVLVDGKACSVLEAVTDARAEKLLNGLHRKKYDFTKAMDYNMESLSISLGSFSKIDVVGED